MKHRMEGDTDAELTMLADTYKLLGKRGYEDCYEVHMRKLEITLDLPIVIGLSVYNWARIKMLEFFYDVLQCA
uniref:Uncharacterized protein n=1 Tax=Romanomermis culicivorax TaxID=13658 RepID=A0A915KE30_ROMCU